MVGKEILSQLGQIFRARSVAIIGASNNSTKWGYSLVERPLRSGFPGNIYPINPGKQAILGVPAYPRIAEVPRPVDLAVFVILQRFGKPVIVVGDLRQAQDAVAEPFRQAGIPSHATLEECALVAYALVRYAEVRR